MYPAEQMVEIAIEVADGRRTPTLAGHPVAAIVRACHDTTIDLGLAALSIPGLDRTSLEPLLTYCAEQRCAADNATCSGCVRRTEADGLRTLDDYIRVHGDVVVGSGGVSLKGEGKAPLTTPSLDDLAKTWAGDELWFFARRALRKLRHGIRSKHAAAPGADRVAGAKPAVILVEPQLADNIGMVARAMANFGLEELRLFNPRDGWPNERARIAASGATFIIDEATAVPSFADAIAPYNWICATTARQRDLAKPVLTPEAAAREMADRIERGERVAMLFGRERNGLETSEIANADAIVMVPVAPKFASLNLAQSVLLLGYEWMKVDGGATLGRVTTYETPRAEGLHNRGSLPADKQTILGFFDHLEAELDRAGFFHPPEKRPTMVQNLRAMFTRLEASEQEVRTLRGLVKALVQGRGPARGRPKE